MTLGTADESGRPWVSPVWFAHSGYREFFWVSSPDARHSINLAARPEVGIVMFDSQVSPAEAEAVMWKSRRGSGCVASRPSTSPSARAANQSR